MGTSFADFHSFPQPSCRLEDESKGRRNPSLGTPPSCAQTAGGTFSFLCNQRGLAAPPPFWRCLDKDLCQKGLGWNKEDDKGRKLGRNEQSRAPTLGSEHLFILSIINPFTDYFNQHTVNNHHSRVWSCLSAIHKCSEGDFICLSPTL